MHPYSHLLYAFGVIGLAIATPFLIAASNARTRREQQRIDDRIMDHSARAPRGEERP